MIKQVWWMERGPLRETGASIDPLLNTMHQATLSQSLGRDPFIPGLKGKSHAPVTHCGITTPSPEPGPHCCSSLICRCLEQTGQGLPLFSFASVSPLPGMLHPTGCFPAPAQPPGSAEPPAACSPHPPPPLPPFLYFGASYKLRRVMLPSPHPTPIQASSGQVGRLRFRGVKETYPRIHIPS